MHQSCRCASLPFAFVCVLCFTENENDSAVLAQNCLNSVITVFGLVVVFGHLCYHCVWSGFFFFLWGGGGGVGQMRYDCVWSGCCFWSSLLTLCLVWVLFLVNSVITVFGLVVLFCFC